MYQTFTYVLNPSENSSEMACIPFQNKSDFTHMQFAIYSVRKKVLSIVETAHPNTESKCACISPEMDTKNNNGYGDRSFYFFHSVCLCFVHGVTNKLTAKTSLQIKIILTNTIRKVFFISFFWKCGCECVCVRNWNQARMRRVFGWDYC